MLGALLFGVFTVGALNPLAAYAFSQSETLESSLRSGRSNSTSAFAAPWLRQKTGDGDTIIGAKAVLNGGLELSDVVLFSLDASGDIVERRDAARAYLRDGYWELHDVRRLRGGNQLPKLETDRVATNLRPEFVQERLARPTRSRSTSCRRKSRSRDPSDSRPTASPHNSTRSWRCHSCWSP